MKGIWFWPSESKEQEKTLQSVLREDEFVTILLALAKGPDGLSNAQLDKLLENNSQWRTLLHVKELMALGFVEYRVQFFGEDHAGLSVGVRPSGSDAISPPHRRARCNGIRPGGSDTNAATPLTPEIARCGGACDALE